MGKSQEPLKVTCPCCKEKLSVDAALGVVLSHEEPPRKGPDVDLTNAAGILSEQQRRREDKFADSWFQETNKEDILAKKFEEAMKKAKDAPAGKPIRDIDRDGRFFGHNGPRGDVFWLSVICYPSLPGCVTFRLHFRRQLYIPEHQLHFKCFG